MKKCKFLSDKTVLGTCLDTSRQPQSFIKQIPDKLLSDKSSDFEYFEDELLSKVRKFRSNSEFFKNDLLLMHTESKFSSDLLHAKYQYVQSKPKVTNEFLQIERPAASFELILKYKYLRFNDNLSKKLPIWIMSFTKNKFPVVTI